MASGERAVVALGRASGYEEAELRAAVEGALDALGGVEGLFRGGARVFVKVNHLSPPSPPERAIVTHPHFAAAVLSALQDLTPHLTVGDDLHPSAEDGFAVSGYREVCSRLGVRLVNLRETGFVRVPVDGAVLREAYLAREAIEADFVVNLPKLKTHSLTLFTGAVKNLYGLLPGGLRVAYHGQYKGPEEFNGLLVDLYAVIRPALTVMDGVVAMEGAGPAGGHPRPLGVVLASRDGVAVDAVACRLIGLDPLAVRTTRYAHARGVGVGDLAAIEVVGERLESMAVQDFKLPPLPAGEIVGRAPRFLARWATSGLAVRPAVVGRACVGCGACARICPTGAARLSGGKARIDRRACIRCMCCHEVCRYGAIALRRPVLGRALRPLLRRPRPRRTGP
ncbi:MAG: DUF362 domain-containing protein [Candidatus Bipolaricaulota bacterium]|nr:DUF362 domain-containing protein [Candidatus Bipolaricaulota bacterium]